MAYGLKACSCHPLIPIIEKSMGEQQVILLYLTFSRKKLMIADERRKIVWKFQGMENILNWDRKY